MRITICDNCERELMREKETVSFYFPTIFKLIEKPGNSPYLHSIRTTGKDERNYTKHFCSEGCIGQYYEKAKVSKKSTDKTLERLIETKNS